METGSRHMGRYNMQFVMSVRHDGSCDWAVWDKEAGEFYTEPGGGMLVYDSEEECARRIDFLNQVDKNNKFLERENTLNANARGDAVMFREFISLVESTINRISSARPNQRASIAMMELGNLQQTCNAVRSTLKYVPPSHSTRSVDITPVKDEGERQHPDEMTPADFDPSA